MVLVVSYVFVVLTILSMDLRISQATSRVTFHESSVSDYHQQWMIQFSRVYSNESEKQMRLKVFKKNLKFIEDFNNNGNQSCKLGVNKFTDLTQEEFLATYTGCFIGSNLTSPSEVVDETINNKFTPISAVVGKKQLQNVTTKEWKPRMSYQAQKPMRESNTPQRSSVQNQDKKEEASEKVTKDDKEEKAKGACTERGLSLHNRFGALSMRDDGTDV